MSIKPFLENYIVQASIYARPMGKVPWIWLRIHKTGGTSIWDGYLKTWPGVINKAFAPDKYARWLNQLLESDEYFIWTIVRDTYQRFLSAAGMFGVLPEFLVSNFEKYCQPKGVNWRHTRPQHLFIQTQDGVQVPKFIGRFENLQSDFEFICNRLDIPAVTLPHLNKSGRKNPLSQQVTDFVNRYYEKDFELLNYKML